jgi:hypothetical protein
MNYSGQILLGYIKAKDADTNTGWKLSTSKTLQTVMADCEYAASVVKRYAEFRSDIDYLGVATEDACQHMGQWMYEMGSYSSTSFINELAEYISKTMELI